MSNISRNNQPSRVLLVGMANKVFIPDLQRHLRDQGIAADALDLLLGTWTHCNGQVDVLGTSVTTKNFLIKNILLIKNLRAAKKAVQGRKQHYDICNIHFLDVKYFFFRRWIRTLAPHLIISTYGSDFYKYRKFRLLQLPLYKKARAITFTNRKTLVEFDHYHQERFNQKLRKCSFGLSNLPALMELISVVGFREKAKIHFGFPTDKIIITLGYHSNPIHQHEEMIDAISLLPDELKKRVFLVLPMAYGGFSQHIHNIEMRLIDSGMPYFILKEFLPTEEIIWFRAASDIMINVPLSDQFSATMQEYLIAKNIVITGAWLPYGALDDIGIVYHRISDMQKLSGELKTIVADFMQQALSVKNNPQRIGQLSDWEENIKDWIDTYTL